jgi:2,4-dienoyl-CoA reductase (NADPH2)
MKAAEIAGLGADSVVVATGARIEVAKIEGAELPHVSTGSMWRGLMGGRLDEEAEQKLPAWQRRGMRLLGGAAQRLARPATLRRVTRGWLPMGKRIVVIGSDLAAIELAEFLAHRDRSVTVLGEADGIAPEVGPKRRMEHMQSLDRAGVVLNTGVSIDRIEPEGVVLRLGWGERCVPADHVLIAGEPVADESLADALRASRVEVHAVGDCTGLGLLQGALLEGARAGCAV